MTNSPAPEPTEAEIERAARRDSKKRDYKMLLSWRDYLYSVTFGAETMEMIYYVPDATGKKHEVILTQDCLLPSDRTRVNRAAAGTIALDFVAAIVPPELRHLFPDWEWG